MKKLLLALIAVPMFMATAQNLQVRSIVFNPAPQCPTPSTTTVSVSVVGGTAPYTFLASGVTPTVSGNTATFVFPVAGTNATITVRDSSSPALTTSFGVSLFPQPFTTARFDFLSPCAGRANGRITLTVTGARSTFYVLNGTSIPATSNRIIYANVNTGTFNVAALAPVTTSCGVPSSSSVGVTGVQLNAFENSFITNLSDYIVRAYCQQCFTRTAPTTVVSSCNACGSSSGGCNSCC